MARRFSSFSDRGYIGGDSNPFMFVGFDPRTKQEFKFDSNKLLEIIKYYSETAAKSIVTQNSVEGLQDTLKLNFYGSLSTKKAYYQFATPTSTTSIAVSTGVSQIKLLFTTRTYMTLSSYIDINNYNNSFFSVITSSGVPLVSSNRTRVNPGQTMNIKVSDPTYSLSTFYTTFYFPSATI